MSTGLLGLLLCHDMRSVETMIAADKTNRGYLKRLYYEAGPARFSIRLFTDDIFNHLCHK